MYGYDKLQSMSMIYQEQDNGAHLMLGYAYQEKDAQTIVAALNFYEQHQITCDLCGHRGPDVNTLATGGYLCDDGKACRLRAQAHEQPQVQCYICERTITSFRETHGEKVCSNADDCIAFYNSQYGFV